MTTLLPIISIANLASDDRAVRDKEVAKLGHACREIGFFYAADHGIPAQLLADMFTYAHEIFALPMDKKLAVSIKRSRHNRGYVGIEDEMLDPEAGADFKEGFDIGDDYAPDHPDVLANKPFRGVNFWPPLDEGWKDKVKAYQAACLELVRVIHRGFSQDLGIDPRLFERALEKPIITLRLLRYPGTKDGVTRPDGGAGTHTDYGNLTVLATDDVAGLQVKTRSGEWLDAPHVDGAFVCNIGDCLMRWTNDTYVSTPHRVGMPKRVRYSIPVFFEVDPEFVVDPRDIRPLEEPHYPPVTCAEYLSQRLDATYAYRRNEKQ